MVSQTSIPRASQARDAANGIVASLTNMNAPAATNATAGSGGGVVNTTRNSIFALPPGLRFRPTDVELLLYYLKRKIYGKSLRLNAIASVDIYKTEPWELPAKAQIKTHAQEWYFFNAVDCNPTDGVRMDRSTNKGHWKATGNDRVVKYDDRIVGLKKTLIFYCGPTHDGMRTNWVMHEYRLAEEELNKCGVWKDLYVLCKLLYKSDTSPPVEHPYVEEDEDDEGEALLGEVIEEEEAATAETSKPEQESPPYPEDAAPNIRGQLPARVRGLNVSPAAVDNKRRKTAHLD